ncbi:DUF6402 family protein [Photorhabdus tasmaniensis]|uniref:DUF6402 family protein n=1 Tax=Photorhabdus tasmaniensis TaxID=1004159 RepID=UPI0040432426
MKIFITSEQKIKLERLHDTTRDGQVRDRIKAILLASEGWSFVMIALAVKGYVDKLNSKDIFVTEQIGMYLKDTYDFVGAREPLGIWSKNGILDKISSVDYAALYATGSWLALWIKYNGYVPVINGSFRKWQKKHNEGGDFMVFSDILWMEPLPQNKIIHL